MLAPDPTPSHIGVTWFAASVLHTCEELRIRAGDTEVVLGKIGFVIKN